MSPHTSDTCPTDERLWKPPVAMLELGLLGASGLVPMKTWDGRSCTDAYCVAKYGPKWVRTRIVMDSMSPKWNEQYTWEVYDPCTVLTVGVFDNHHLTNHPAIARRMHNASSRAALVAPGVLAFSKHNFTVSRPAVRQRGISLEKSM
ncbi:hypothetical protein L7F22_048921 [Adiantum nelumboides]|nr:hypothetical protein [Adiantum nelumboides]